MEVNIRKKVGQAIDKAKSFDFWAWLDERAKLSELPLVGTPDYMFKLGYWTGGMTAAAFFWQVISGLLLLMYYEPGNAYSSTEYIVNNVAFGKILLASHLYGAYAMIFLAFVHLFRNYFVGAYKKPRELQWVLGVIMGAAVLGTAFFGYSLVGDTLSVDGADVAKGLLQGAPLGSLLLNIFFGPGGETAQFTRVLAWHITLAALVALLFALHLGLAEQNGVMPSPKLFNYKSPAELDRKEAPKWWPNNFLYTAAILFWVWGFILIIPSILLMLPQGSIPILLSPLPGPSPTSAAAASIPPYPLWFFLNVYKIVDFQLPLFQGGSGPFIAVTVGGIIPLLYLLLLPFLDRSDKLHPLDRMVHTVIIIWLITVWLIIYAIWGALTPGLPIPPIRVAEVTLIPTAIILAGMAFVYATWKGPKPGNMKQPTLREIAVKRAYATLVLAFLVAVEVIITAALWKVLPDGSFEPMIGVLVGAGLVVFGEIIALYRYIAYPPKPGRSK
ncbi:cytochrome b6 [Thermocladium modestius]|uniref:Cytochrome b6 n=1 Tax=Thermocladium modestius TaxID=62609 RepID=A0A830GT65_9CREN|nr:cytochrome bc complex cytochrome b subunit [Thermocladium modestius]GGP20617.1 cytochrome b6 [Thermocladium modestius]